MTTAAQPILDIECITDVAKAAVLVQHPLRLEILARAGEPVSATELARSLGLSRQGVNYHVRRLAKAGYLRLAGRRVRRNLVERQYVATARSYVLSPQILGPMAAGAAEPGDSTSAFWLLGLTSLAQQELTTVTQAATRAGVRVRTLSQMSTLRFADATQRAAFTKALIESVAAVIAQHTTPGLSEVEESAKGQAYRLVLGFYPTPDEAKT